MAGLKILVVEDYYAVRQLLRDALQEIGHTVTEVARFEEGEREISRNIYDLVITDVRLPGGTGEDLAAKASALGGQVGQVRSVLDKRVGDAVTVAAAAGALRAAKSLSSSSRMAFS